MRHMIVDQSIVIVVSRDELRLLSGAIRETMEAVEEWEFSTRLGVEVVEAATLQAELREAIQTLPKAV